MTERRFTQVPLEVAETPSTVQRRFTQVPLEVVETPATVQRRVSQVVLEVMYTVEFTGGYWGIRIHA